MSEGSKQQQSFTHGDNAPMYLLGAESMRQKMAFELKSLPFIYHPPFENIFSGQLPRSFLLAACDFSSDVEIKTLVRCFLRVENIPLIKVIYITQDSAVTLDQLIFCVHLGCEYVCWGARGGDHLRQFIKMKMGQTINRSHYDRIHHQIITAATRRDFVKIRQITHFLVNTAKNDINALKLLVKANQYLNEHRKIYSYLKQILKLNRQDIWAASCLARMYVDSNDIYAGMEVLQRETDFVTSKGQVINFQSGLFSFVNSQPLTKTVLSFLNLRAVMSIRCNNMSEGINFYKVALAGSYDSAILAKLHFNIGIAYLKSHEGGEAEFHLSESLRYGEGDGYLKAAKPLRKAKKMLATVRQVTPKSEKAEPEEDDLVEEQWEVS